MSLYSCDPRDFAPIRTRTSVFDLLSPAAVGFVCVATLGLLAGWILATRTTPPPRALDRDIETNVRRIPPRTDSARSTLLFDATTTSGGASFSFAMAAPLRAHFQALDAADRAEGISTVAKAAPPMDGEPLGQVAVGRKSDDADRIRLAELSPSSPAQRIGLRANELSRSPRTAGRPDARVALDRLLGPTGPAVPTGILAYADPQDGVRSPPPPLLGDDVSHEKTTAVYDITAHTVHMPDGTKLEAHSGLREMMDNPKFAHVRMRGATPPAVYTIKLREALFHGVRALRLTPIDSKIFGRDGILAHTYMLGARGDSNGCVVFKNYDAFLQAFLKSKVTRLNVVARWDATVDVKVAEAASDR